MGAWVHKDAGIKLKFSRRVMSRELGVVLQHINSILYHIYTILMRGQIVYSFTANGKLNKYSSTCQHYLLRPSRP